MTSISKAATTEPAPSPSFHPTAAVAATGVGGAGTLHRQRSTEDDRVALITNLPPGTTELTLGHFLHGTMARKGMKAGAEPPIAKVRLLTPSDEEKVEQTRTFEADEEGSKASTLNIKPDDTPPPTTTAALVEFATSEDCQMAILMLEEESGNNNNTASARNGVSRDTIAAVNTVAAVPVTLQGHRLHIEKLTDTYHVDHADRNESIRNSVNKRNGMAKYGTDYSKLDKGHLSQEVNRLEEALSLERVALHQTRDELLNEQGRQVENEELLFSAAAAVMNRTKEALAVERAKRSSLEEQVGRLEKLLFQAEKEIQRLRGGGSGISPAVEEEAYRSSPVALPEEEMDDVDDDTPPPPLEKIQPNRLENFFLSAEAADQ